MAAVARREAIRSRATTPEPLIGSAAMGCTEGINPILGNIGDLGAGIAQIGVATTQQPQPRHFATGVNPIFVGTRPYSAHAGTTMGGGGGVWLFCTTRREAKTVLTRTEILKWIEAYDNQIIDR